MSTATSHAMSAAIAVSAERTLGYAHALLDPIPDPVFAHLAHPEINHPAFVVGHLALYLDKCLDLLGRSELAVPYPFDEATFKDGAPCVEQDGRYPAKDELLEYFFNHSATVLKAVAETPAERFAMENPMEGRMKEFFPTIGVAINFLLNNHVMMHLGQVSAWRRLMGLGSAM